MEHSDRRFEIDERDRFDSSRTPESRALRRFGGDRAPIERFGWTDTVSARGEAAEHQPRNSENLDFFMTPRD